MVDDVTRMNAAPVGRIFCVRTVDDIKEVLRLAREKGVPVSVRGTRHSMGGHTIAKGGYVIDCLKFNRWSFDSEKELVTTQPGALWADLIAGLNEWGYSPRTMQSYSTFSVGGSLAVNAHGITTDFCGAEGVVSFTLIKWDGTEVVCSRDAEGEAGELFSLALGGYGMFGVFAEITMLVNNNVHLSMDMIQMDTKDFTRYYQTALADPADDIEIKLARMDVTNLDNCQLFIFRRDGPAGMRTVSKLGSGPREMSVQQQLLYKWIMPSFKEVRSAVEQSSGKAVDWSDENERNLLMYESAVPLARMYSPLYRVDDTFVLQEFFVPAAGFDLWVKGAKPIYKAAEQLEHVNLLNTTIRYVHHDTDTVLPYSKVEGGSYAFVLYYRIYQTEEADEELSSLHSKFVALTLPLGGTFYLPYRHHYTEQEMDEAYPSARHFFERKQHYDPQCLFRSQWFEAFGRRFWDGEPAPTSAKAESLVPAADAAPEPDAISIPAVSEHRTDSFARLMADRKLRTQFREKFLTQIFVSPRQLSFGGGFRV